ncbi:hypothetical protein KC19_2G058800 [Ceratodon purpureus]|uniref:Uncharacterized protein n=1 Tax=Ceratodon purpureus TaxID=3225 RepID=A0A8T0ITP9_CERPU|nr:hypothetical protein KC19_2G058800 [Ceratodon purpureus]
MSTPMTRTQSESTSINITTREFLASQPCIATPSPPLPSSTPHPTRLQSINTIHSSKTPPLPTSTTKTHTHIPTTSCTHTTNSSNTISSPLAQKIPLQHPKPYTKPLHQKSQTPTHSSTKTLTKTQRLAPTPPPLSSFHNTTQATKTSRPKWQLGSELRPANKQSINVPPENLNPCTTALNSHAIDMPSAQLSSNCSDLSCHNYHIFPTQ